jgi:hypothetical protein
LRPASDIEVTGHYSSATIGFNRPCEGHGITKAKITRSLEIASEEGSVFVERRNLDCQNSRLARMAAWFVNEA